ncbi:protein of unknown function [Acidithiobacillus ferrivorans]|uniref:Uncharacterized protein n=1 Tax=Acidithiobacillus ferrivorans TaxID=160808 RepID=A0A060UMW0_9PROT|nr:hypothetical protein AFERRI_370066 [Acidithiobacillus ferrivorans]SMH65709.1 protein of unknown function [Acidithiobacillus ferrivorans]
MAALDHLLSAAERPRSVFNCHQIYREYYGSQSSVSKASPRAGTPWTIPALFAVQSGASVKQIRPPVIQGKRQDDTLLSVNKSGHPFRPWRFICCRASV